MPFVKTNFPNLVAFSAQCKGLYKGPTPPPSTSGPQTAYFQTTMKLVYRAPKGAALVKFKE